MPATLTDMLTGDARAQDGSPGLHECLAARLARMLWTRGQQEVFTERGAGGEPHVAGARVEMPYALAFASAQLAGGHRAPVTA
jgi:hypothetical protein